MASSLILEIYRIAYQSEHPTYKLPLDILKIENCNAMTVDEDLPQAIPSRSSNLICQAMPIQPYRGIIDKYKELSSQELGQTNITRLIIDTGDAQPVKVQAQLILFHLVDQVQL